MTAQTIKQFETKHKDLLHKWGVDTPLRKAHFLTQIWHESHLKAKSENLNYSAPRLVVIFSKHFTNATAPLLANKPQAIANKVYGNRMGNGDGKSGDGFKFRGRGYIQLTGKNNYTLFSQASGVDAVNNPDLLLQEDIALMSALWFWKTNNINALADANDLKGVRKRVNGGHIGLADCQSVFNQIKDIF